VSPPPDEERTTSPRKVTGRREGVGGAIKEGVVDDTTEQQGEVVRANMVKAIWCGWVGGGTTLTEELGARGMLRRPVQQRGWVRGRTFWMLPSTVKGRDGASTKDVLRAPSSMSSRSMSARIASRGPARSSHGRLDARSCGIENKVGRRYLVAGLLIRKRARSGQLGSHPSLVLTAILDKRKCLGLRSPCGRSLPLPFSLGDNLSNSSRPRDPSYKIGGGSRGVE
jgi:hypothetical protein